MIKAVCLVLAWYFAFVSWNIIPIALSSIASLLVIYKTAIEIRKIKKDNKKVIKDE